MNYYYQVNYNPLRQFVEKREDGWYIVDKPEFLPESIADIAVGPYNDNTRFVPKEDVPVTEYGVGKAKLKEVEYLPNQ